MKKLLFTIGVGVSLVWGGEFAANLTKCLMDHTTSKDLALLKKWIFFGFAQIPEVKPYTRITKEELEQTNREVARFFMRLLTVDCRNEFKKAVEKEGDAAIRTAFQFLGKQAGQEVFSSPYVQIYLKGFGKYLDEKKLEKVLE